MCAYLLQIQKIRDATVVNMKISCCTAVVCKHYKEHYLITLFLAHMDDIISGDFVLAQLYGHVNTLTQSLDPYVFHTTEIDYQ